jgi:hypothetical protein
MGQLGCEHKSNGACWGWIFPPLGEARAAWELRYGKMNWLRPGIAEWNSGATEGVETDLIEIPKE